MEHSPIFTSVAKPLVDPQLVNWRQLLGKYQAPDLRSSVLQIITSVGPFLVLWVAAWYSLRISYLLTLLLAFLAAAFMMRVFIIFHDCGHGSFFRSRQANVMIGSILGVLVFTPFYHWTHDHAVHHATAGDLDRRGVGDVKTLTVKEYIALNPLMRLGYRIMRQPLFMFTIGAFLVFTVFHRFYHPASGQRERQSVHLTNLALLGILVLAHFTIGLKSFFLVQIPLMAFATSVGVWMFYVQHNFEGTYWERHDRWDYYKAGLYGSSYYRLPRLLQWFTGNIGFHHIHHLNSRIPNYLLEKAQKENLIFNQVKPLTLRSSLKCLSYRLWDEDRSCLVNFNGLKAERGI